MVTARPGPLIPGLLPLTAAPARKPLRGWDTGMGGFEPALAPEQNPSPNELNPNAGISLGLEVNKYLKFKAVNESTYVFLKLLGKHKIGASA